MNNARIWTVVSPTVGVPIFFIALALTSVFIHVFVLGSTGIGAKYWQGLPLNP